jgi:hypothetical protein
MRLLDVAVIAMKDGMERVSGEAAASAALFRTLR